MAFSQIVNSIGLILDAIAAGLFLLYGVASDVRPEGASFLRLEQDDENKAKQYERNVKINKIAFAMFFFGFLLQIIALYI